MTSVLKVDNIQNSSGTSALGIGSDGAVYPRGLTYWPMIYYRKSSSQTAAAAGEKLSFDTKVVDNGSNYSTSTSIFTAPCKGVYLVNTNLLTQNNSQDVDIRIEVNGSNYGMIRSSTQSGHKSYGMSHLLSLAEDDEVHLEFSSVNDVIYGDSGYWSILSIAYIGG